jgi:hypothetical protein
MHPVSDPKDTAAEAELKEWFAQHGPPRFDPSPVQFDVARWERRGSPSSRLGARRGANGRGSSTTEERGDHPEWLHSFMVRWADPVLHYLYGSTGDVDAAQRSTRRVFLSAARAAGGSPPRPSALFRLADHMVPPPSASAPRSRWADALRGLSTQERALAALAVYGGTSVQLAARGTGPSEPSLGAALQHLRTALGEAGPDPDSEEAWRQWIGHLESFIPKAPVPFDWDAWARDAASLRKAPGIRPRQVGWAAAAALILATSGYVLSLRNTAATPQLPFTPVAFKGRMNLVVADGTAVAAHPFGSAKPKALAGTAISPAFESYQVQTITAATPSAAYEIGPINAGIAVDSQGTALVLRMTGGQVPQVYNLAGQGQLVAATSEPGGYLVYQFVGNAGAVRVEAAGKAVTLAWAEANGPEPFVHVESGVWSPAAGQPLAQGPLGSRVFAAPPGKGSAVGVLSDGVLWESVSRWWLVPAAGPAIPLMRITQSSVPPVNLTIIGSPYPTSANEVVMQFPMASNGNGSALWWNLAEDRWGSTATVELPGLFLVPAGWIQSLPPTFMSSAAPPALKRLPLSFLALAGQGHEVFGETIERGGIVKNPGTYNWATRTFTPARVAGPTAQGVVVLPGWGPTWVEVPGAQEGSMSNSVPGPATVKLVAFNGKHQTTVTLGVGEQLRLMGEWLLEASTSGHAASAAWPNTAGELVWHVINPGTAVYSGTDYLYWAADGHTYVWMPPFAWPFQG